MNAKEFFSRIMSKRDTKENWELNDLKLLSGETVIVVYEDGIIRKKTGDGVSNYSALNFDDEYVVRLTNTKLNIAQGAENAGKIMAVDSSGNVAPTSGVIIDKSSLTWGKLLGMVMWGDLVNHV